MLNVIDEFTHECLAIRVSRKLKATDVVDVLSDLFILRGVPGHIRSDHSPEFIAKAVQEWITAVGAKTAYIAPGSPWENGFIESFAARLMDKLLDGEIFYSLKEAQIMIEGWRRHYTTLRPHESWTCPIKLIHSEDNFFGHGAPEEGPCHEEDALHRRADRLCAAPGGERHAGG
jgi:transposase InsO family protein